MSFHPIDVARRGRGANWIVAGVLLFLLGGFFRSQILNHQKYALQSETNRLRELPLPAPRGVIYDRTNKVIADNVIGYSVSVLAIPSAVRSATAHVRLGDFAFPDCTSVTPFHWVSDPGNTKGSPSSRQTAACAASVWPMFIALPRA